MLEPNAELTKKLEEAACPPTLIDELLKIDERARDLEEIYSLHTTRTPKTQRLDLRVYVNGRPIASATLAVPDPAPPREPLKPEALELAVKTMTEPLEALWRDYVGQVTDALKL